MIVNYTGTNIVINTDNKYNIDYSEINNYLPNENSIILADGEKAEFKPMANVYIITEDCQHLGHFMMSMMSSLPQDPIIYVGIKRGNQIWLSNSNALQSDVDFGLARVLDRSNPLIMYFNPYYGILVYIILLTLIIFVIFAGIKMYKIAFR